jgi:hypothetical protein
MIVASRAGEGGTTSWRNAAVLAPIDASDDAGFSNSFDVSSSPQSCDCGEVFFYIY